MQQEFVKVPRLVSTKRRCAACGRLLPRESFTEARAPKLTVCSSECIIRVETRRRQAGVTMTAEWALCRVVD